MRASHLVMGIAALCAGWWGAVHIDGTLSRGRARAPARQDAAPLTVSANAPIDTPSAAPDGHGHGDPDNADKLGTFRLTRYYVAEESGYARPGSTHGDDGGPVLAATTGPGGITLYDDRGCKPLAHVGARFAEVLDVQGTGRLNDGRVLNIAGACRCSRSPCYRPVGDAARWGLGATSNPLEPFRSVAVDPRMIPLGTVLYIPELDGLTMPGQSPWGGFTHDGCVVASDVGGGVDGKHIDFFVGRFAYKKALDARGRMKQVTVYRGDARCASHRPTRSAKAGS